MKKLILIRHGKSSWDLPLKDLDRPLAKRGISDANLMSEQIKNYLPNKFLFMSSPARRTLDTATIFALNLLIPEELVIQSKEIYTFDYKLLANYIKNVNNEHNNLILFGHNSAITDFVNKFGDIYIENVPTSGIVILEFNQDNWKNIQNGQITKTIFPKDFKNESKKSEQIHR